MLTQCPECSTHFRVRPEQLRAAGGRVRCGRCNCLFDAQPARPGANAALSAPHEQAPLEQLPGTDAGGGNLAWVFGSLLLIVLAVAQAAWWDRHALAKNAELLPLLVQACEHLPCELKTPRSVENIQVLSRSLNSHPETQGVLRFRLRMTNRWDRPQAYPLIELGLLDRNGKLAAIRRFNPENYLPAHKPGDLMPQNKELEVQLELQDTEWLVGGFRIDFL